MSCLLRMEHITKRFGSFVANNDISLELNRGEVVTLLGENGAGKSTLMNVLCGLYHPTEGKIYLDGKEVRINSPGDAVQLGIGMVHQHFMLIEAMTVFQNIIMGLSSDKSIVINENKLKKEISALSEKYGLDIEFDQKITDISVGEQQRVEILKALWRGAEILILDEPTAVLTDEETEGLFEIIHRLQSEGKGIFFISHKLREVMKISDRILVLRRGDLVGEIDNVAETTEQFLADTMVGSHVEESKYEKHRFDTEPLMRLKDVSYRKESKHNGLNGVTLDVHRGEILGIAGVDGNGQSQLAGVVAGLYKPDEGEVDFKGERVSVFAPKYFIDEHLSHIPEDRNRMGLVGGMSIKENLILKDRKEKGFTSWKGWRLNNKAISAYADEMREKYDIRCANTDQPAGSLSGGNQQKVILARELELNPDMILAAHPIRGLDIGAANHVHSCLMDARDKGCGVLLISADLAEILQVSDRIAVMFEGKVMGIFDGVEPPVKKISLAMAGRQYPLGELIMKDEEE